MTTVTTSTSPAKASVMTVTMAPNTWPRNSPSERQALVDSPTAPVPSSVAPVRRRHASWSRPIASPTTSKAGRMYSSIERKPATMPPVTRRLIAHSLANQVTTVAMAPPTAAPKLRNSAEGSEAAPPATSPKRPPISSCSTEKASARSSKTGRASSMVRVKPSLKPSQICWMR